MPVTDETPVEPKRTTKFGWCLTGQHPDCPQKNGSVECHCKCHSNKKETKKKSVKRK